VRPNSGEFWLRRLARGACRFSHPRRPADAAAPGRPARRREVVDPQSLTCPPSPVPSSIGGLHAHARDARLPDRRLTRRERCRGARLGDGEHCRRRRRGRRAPRRRARRGRYVFFRFLSDRRLSDARRASSLTCLVPCRAREREEAGGVPGRRARAPAAHHGEERGRGRGPQDQRHR
jgi:hypothetical protein